MSKTHETNCKCPDAGLPAWVMTFADLMSLLLAFFVLLFSFSELDKEMYKQLSGSMRDAFGVQREIKAQETPRGINIIAREFSPGKTERTPINEVRQITTDDLKLHPVFTDPSKQGQENANTILAEEEIELRERIKQDNRRLEETLVKEIEEGAVDLEITERGIIIRVREKGSFPSGSADIIKPFENIVDKISAVFRSFDGVIIVSGHTDNIPIKTNRFRSNWELSSSRAVSVIEELVKTSALREKRFKIAAYAETQPVDSNDTSIGRAKNRRVEIMMDYSDNKEPEQIDTSMQEKPSIVQPDTSVES